MTSDRERAIERICQVALERPPAERAGFVAEACGADEGLRREVDLLLQHDELASRFLEQPAVDVAARTLGSTPESLNPGQCVGSYTIVSLLGAGGMGQVYRARDTTLGREVAIKILPAIFTDDPERLARFEREARVLATLNHPNIATIHGVERVASGSLHALVLELVEGETLSDRLATRRSGLPIADVLAIARQIADALEAAHDKGVVHRDLKPSNIKVRPDGVVKVLDFGLAKATALTGPGLSHSPTITISGTRDGVLLGTAAYMSPEQARGVSVDKRADIWAFGCVLYEILTGRVAFLGDTVSDTISAILSREWDRTALPATVPVEIARLLRRCLDKDPERRLHDIADARIEIDEATARDVDVSTVAMQRRHRRWWTVVGTMTALLAILAMAAALYSRPEPRRPEITRLDVVTPPTRDAVSIALSDDGRQLAFAALSEGTMRLWLRRLDQPTAQPLPGTEDASYPFWAPDGRAIGFFAEGKLKRIDLPDGVLRPLADAPAGRGASWNHDGTILFAPNPLGPLIRVPDTGGSPKEVTRMGDGEIGHRWPQFLPDGDRFLFWATKASDRQTGAIYLGSLEGVSPVRVIDAEAAGLFAPPDFLLVARQGMLTALRFDVTAAIVRGDPIQLASNVGLDLSNSILRYAITVSRNGVLAHRSVPPQRRQLVWRDRTGRALGTIQFDSLALGPAAFTSNGQRLAVWQIKQGNQDVWLLDVNRGVPTRFTFGAGQEMFPLWSPDGNRVVFLSNRNGPFDLFEKAANGVGDEHLMFESREDKWPMDWSPDGQTLLFDSFGQDTDGDIWAMPLDGDRRAFPVVRTRFSEGLGQFSSDGRWVAYQSNESGRFEIYVQAFPTPEGKYRVSTRGGTQPRWSRNGRELFYVAADGYLTSVPMALTATVPSPQAGPPQPLFPAGLSSAAGTYFVAESRMKHQYSVAPDGRFLFNLAVDELPSSISVVLNWDAGLTK